MRKDILSLIKDETDITNVVVLTHNIDFVFVQKMLLTAIKKCGHPSLTIFADAECAAQSYEAQHLVLNSIGRSYRVVSVTMQPGFRFHPKAILLSGKKKGVLLVGSGNLTFGGWRENAEIWCRFDTDQDGTAPFAAFRDYLFSVTSLISLKAGPEGEIEEAFDGKTRDWARDMEAPAQLIGKPGNQASLLDQMKSRLGDEPINEILVCAPYFDDDGEALKAFYQNFDVPLKVAFQQKRSDLSAECAKSLEGIIFLNTVDFLHKKPDGSTRTAFIHAKWYGFKSRDTVTLFAGSANCSKAALTIPGRKGNAELVAELKLDNADFDENFTNELDFLDVPPEFIPVLPEDKSDSNSKPFLRCLAASLDQTGLQIACQSSPGVKIARVLINDDERPFSVSEDGVLFVNQIELNDQYVVVEGEHSKELLLSNRLWIDYENDLKTSARKRNVIDVVRGKVQIDTWNIGAWNEIMNVFCKNLNYLPENMGLRPPVKTDQEKEEDSPPVYKAGDVFRSDFGAGKFSSGLSQPMATIKDRTISLHGMLIRWFGLKGEDIDPPVDVIDPDNGDGEGEDVVDRPEKVIGRKKPKPPVLEKDIFEKEKKRTQAILDKLVQVMSSEDYACSRPPDILSIDLQFAAILLRVALREEWLSLDEFFSATHKIWSAFFFYAPPKAPDGWLVYRCQFTDQLEAVKNKFAGPNLMAALLAWMLAIPSEISSPKHARFCLANLLSIARFPWIWDQDPVAVRDALHEVLINSSKTQTEVFLKEMDSRLTQMLEQGVALNKFENVMADKTPVKIKDSVAQNTIQKGEVLWQGNDLGFCIALNKFSRKGRENGEYLSLRSDKAGGLKPDFAIPARYLLKEFMVPKDKPAARILNQIFKNVSSVVLAQNN